MINITRCLYQVTKPNKKTLMEIFEVDESQIGECKTCQYDPINNPKCKAYVPTKLYKFDVK